MISVCGLESWGRIGAALSVYLIVGILIDFGSFLIGVKELSINRSEPSKIVAQLNQTYAFRIIAFSIIAIVLSIIFFIIPDTNYKLYFLGMAMLLAQIFNPIWIYQAFENFKMINRIIFISKAMYVLLVYAIIREKSDYVYVLFILGMCNTIAYGFCFLKIFKEFSLSLMDVSGKSLVENFKKEYPIVISNLSIAVYANGPIIIVRYVAGDYTAGIFKIGDMLLNIIRNYLSVFFNVSFPKFCSHYSINKFEGIAFLKKINTYNLAMISAAIFGTFVAARFFLDQLITDPKIYENQQKAISKITIAGALLMLVSSYFLTMYSGLTGSIISLYLVEFFVTCSIIVKYYRNLEK